MTYRPELADMPARLAALPVHRGYPVPWFVAWQDGLPEFRAMDPHKFARAIRERRCWVCGEPTGKHVAFVIGPMCAINKTSAEPPCHLECATWSARFCPFLSRPHMVRRHDEVMNESAAGEASILRNPGAAGVWVTNSYRLFKAGKDSPSGYLIEMGAPERVLWFSEGRAATRAEVLASIDSGMPFLAEACEQETPAERPAALRALAAARAGVEALLPAAEAAR
jgi:hypothetical protein